MTRARLEKRPWLQSRLGAIATAGATHLKPQHRAALERNKHWLEDRRLVEGALQIGETASDFALPNQQGKVVRLSDRLALGPVFLVFFRGPWCPYCGVTLQAWQRQRHALLKAGGSLLAISPQTPESCAATAKSYRLSYDLLSDVGSEIAGAFRISYPIPAEMRTLYSEVRLRLADHNGGDDRFLPMPSTFFARFHRQPSPGRCSR